MEERRGVPGAGGCPPASGQFWFQCADRKEGAGGPTVEHHLCVNSDVTRTWGTVTRGGLRADLGSPAMWVTWDVTEGGQGDKNHRGPSEAGWVSASQGGRWGPSLKTQTAWTSC